MPATVTAAARSCPSCAAPIDADPRFTAWCPACEWNLGAEEPKGRWRTYRRSRDRARVERLYAQLAGHSSGVHHRSLAGPAAIALAALVHLWTLAVAAGSVWLLLTGYPFLQGVGAIGLALTYLLRPRLGRWRHDKPGTVTRDQAPHLYGLVDRIADELGTRRPDRITVNHCYQASYARLGVRQRVDLTLGMALWSVLTPQERIALLGHELGHGSNGDQRRGLWLHLALDTLVAWYEILIPHRGDAWMIRSSRKRLLDEITTWFLHLCAQPVRLALETLHRLTLRSNQRAEYLADDMSARVGSSQAAASALAKLYLGDSVNGRLRRQRAVGQHGGIAKADDVEEALWSGLREYLDSVPAGERERRARLCAREMTAVDTSHPPTHLRVRLRAERPDLPAAVVADEAEWAAIEAELEPARRRAARIVLGI